MYNSTYSAASIAIDMIIDYKVIAIPIITVLMIVTLYVIVVYYKKLLYGACITLPTLGCYGLSKLAINKAAEGSPNTLKGIFWIIGVSVVSVLLGIWIERSSRFDWLKKLV